MREREELKSAPEKETGEKEILKDVTRQDYDYLANSATLTECTGLLHKTPQNQEEMESYQQVYQYLPPNVKIDTETGEK